MSESKMKINWNNWIVIQISAFVLFLLVGAPAVMFWEPLLRAVLHWLVFYTLGIRLP
nr:MAG TPA: hypothetical protein [Caudoviricetes sp.]